MATNISTIKIKASAEKLWDVLTKPELVKQWQYGSDLVTDWKAGSSIRFRTDLKTWYLSNGVKCWKLFLKN